MNQLLCTTCDSDNIRKDGRRQTEAGLRQRYLCVSCNYRFTMNPFPRMKATTTLVSLCVDLYFKGLSYRGIQDTLKQFIGLKVHHATIMRWIHKGMAEVTEYLDTIAPQVGKVWHADEQVMNVKGKKMYLFNCLDSKTRFLLANKVSKGRTIADARTLFKEAKERSDSIAKRVITDGLLTYHKSIKKEFATRDNPNPHIRQVSIRQERGNNNRLERYHNSFRARDKAFRGFKTKKGLETYGINYRTYYNFFRRHQGLGMTPAERAGLIGNTHLPTTLVRALLTNRQN